jgi:hypothetical protein
MPTDRNPGYAEPGLVSVHEDVPTECRHQRGSGKPNRSLTLHSLAWDSLISQ